MPLLASAKARLQRAKAAQREREAAEKTQGSPEPEAAVQAKVKSYGDALEQYDVAQANKFHGKLQQATPSSKFHLQSGTAGTMIGTARANSVASSAAGYNEECLVPHVAAASAEGLHLRLAMVCVMAGIPLPYIWKPQLQLNDGTITATTGYATTSGLAVVHLLLLPVCLQNMTNSLNKLPKRYVVYSITQRHAAAITHSKWIPQGV